MKPIELRASHLVGALIVVVLMVLTSNHLYMLVKGEEIEPQLQQPEIVEEKNYPPWAIVIDNGFHEIEDDVFEYKAEGNGFELLLNMNDTGPLYRFSNGTLYYDMFLSKLESRTIEEVVTETWEEVSCAMDDPEGNNGTKMVLTDVNTSYSVQDNEFSPAREVVVDGNCFYIYDIYPGIDFVGEVGLFGFKDDYIINDFSSGNRDYEIKADLRFPSDSTFDSEGLTRGNDGITLKEPKVYDKSDNFKSKHVMKHAYKTAKTFPPAGFVDKTLVIELDNARLKDSNLPIHVDPISSPVTTTVSYEDETIIQASDLTIQDGGSLTLTNCILQMDSSSATRTIKVEDGGYFKACEDTLIEAYTAAEYNFKFESGSEGIIDDSEIKEHGKDDKGLWICSDDVYITDSSIHDSDSMGIMVDEACPGIVNTWIHNNTEEGVQVKAKSAPTITGCLIENNVEGVVYLDNSWDPEIEYDYFEEMSGLAVRDEKLRLGLVPIDNSYIDEDCDDHSDWTLWNCGQTDDQYHYFYDSDNDSPDGQLHLYCENGYLRTIEKKPGTLGTVYTTEAKVKFTGLPDDGSDNKGLLFGYYDGAHLVNIFFKDGTINHLQDGGTYDCYSTSTVDMDGLWHIVRIAVDSGNEETKVYLDGEHIKTFTPTFYNWLNNDGGIKIGASCSDSSTVHTYYDWIRIDNDELSTEEATYGFAITNSTTLPANSRWGELVIDKYETDDSWLTVSILDENHNVISGYSDLEDERIDLSGISAFEYEEIRIRFDLEGDADDVYLNDFMLTYGPSNFDSYDFDTTSFISEKTDGIDVFDDALRTKRTYSRAGDDDSVVIYHMDENTGSTVGDSWNGYDGTASGTSWVQGRMGQGLEYSSGDYVSVTDRDALDPDSTLSIEAWIYPTTLDGDGGSGGNTIAAKWYSSGSNGQYIFNAYGDGSGNGYLKFWVHSGSSFDSLTTASTVITEDNWYHVVATYDGSDMKIYVDGEVVAEKTTTISQLSQSEYNSYDDLYIGCLRNLATWSFEGTLDEVKISYRVEDMTLPRYLQDTRDVETGQVLNLRLDETTGTDADDETDCNTATVTGATWDSTGGKFGGCLDLDGSGDYISVPSTSTSMQGSDVEGVVEMWLLPDDISASDQYVFVATNNRDRCLMLNDYTMEAKLFHYTSGWQSITADISDQDSWFHVAYHWSLNDGVDGDNDWIMELYINGHLKASKRLAYSTTAGTDDDYWFGKAHPTQGGANDYAGLMDEVQVYNYDRRYEDCSGYYLDDTDADVAGLYHFERGTTSLARNYEGSTDATLSSVELWAAGRYGSGVQMNGNDYVDLGTINFWTTTETQYDYSLKGTIETWFKLDSDWDETSSNKMVLAGMYDSGYTYSIEFYDYNDGALTFNYSGEYEEFILKTSQTSWDKETWYHVAVVWDGMAFFLYIDGILVDSHSTRNHVPDDENWFLGRMGTQSSDHFTGTLDEVRFSSTDRTIDFDKYRETAMTIAVDRSEWESFASVYMNPSDSVYANATLRVLDTSEYILEETTDNTASFYTNDDEVHIEVSFDLIGDVMASVDSFDMTVSDGLSSSYLIDNTWGLQCGKYDPVITSCILDDNSYGAVCENSTASFNSCTMSDNTVTGVLARHSALSISSSEMKSNVNGFSAVHEDQSVVTSTTFESNDRGCYVRADSDNVISGTFTTNDVSLRTEDATPRILNSNLSGAVNDEIKADVGGTPSTVSLVDCIYDVSEFDLRHASSKVEEQWEASVTPYWASTVDVSSYLLGSWSFEEGRGTTTDDASTYENDATLNYASWAQGSEGTGIYFDGEDDYIDTSYNPAEGLYDVTLEAWVYPDADIDDYGCIVGRMNAGGTEGLILRYNSDNKWQFRDIDSAKDVSSDSTVTTGQWQHIVGTIDGSGNMYMYVNGELQTDTETGADAGSMELDTYIGWSGYASSTHYFMGTIDEVNLYCVALDEDVIKTRYNLGTRQLIEIDDDDATNVYKRTVVGGSEAYSTYLTERVFTGTSETETYETPHDISVGTDNGFYAEVFGDRSFSVALGGDSDFDRFKDTDENDDDIMFFDPTEFFNSGNYYGGGLVQPDECDILFKDEFPIIYDASDDWYYKFFVRAKLANSSCESDLELTVKRDTSTLINAESHPVDTYWKWFQTEEFEVVQATTEITLMAVDESSDGSIIVDDVMLVRLRNDGGTATSVESGMYTCPYESDIDGDGVDDGIEVTDHKWTFEAEDYDVSSFSTIEEDVDFENGRYVKSTTVDEKFVEITGIPFETSTDYELWVRCCGTSSSAFKAYDNLNTALPTDISHNPEEDDEPWWYKIEFTSSASTTTGIYFKCITNTVSIDRVMICEADDLFYDKVLVSSSPSQTADLTFDTNGENDDITLDIEWDEYCTGCIFEFDEDPAGTVHELEDESSNDQKTENRVDADGDYVVYDYSSGGNYYVKLYDHSNPSSPTTTIDSDTDTPITKAAVDGNFVVYIDRNSGDLTYALRIYDISNEELYGTRLFAGDSNDIIHSVDVWGDNIVWQLLDYSEFTYKIYYFNFNGDDDEDGTPNYKDGDHNDDSIEVYTSSNIFSDPRIWNNIVTFTNNTGTGYEVFTSYHTFSGDIEEGEQETPGISFYHKIIANVESSEVLGKAEIDKGRVSYSFKDIDGMNTNYKVNVYDIMTDSTGTIYTGDSTIDPLPQIQGNKVIYRSDTNVITVEDINTQGTETISGVTTPTVFTMYDGQCYIKDTSTDVVETILRDFSLEIDGTEVWNHTGIFTGAEKSTDISSYVNAYLSANLDATEVPLLFKSGFHYTTSSETLDIEEFWQYTDDQVDPLSLDSDGDQMDDAEELFESYGEDILEFEDSVNFKEWGQPNILEECDPGEGSSITEYEYEAGAFFYQTGVDVRSSTYDYQSSGSITQDSWVELIYKAEETGTYTIEISPHDGPDLIKIAEMDMYGKKRINEGNPVSVKMEDCAIYLSDDEEWYVEAVATECAYVEITHSTGIGCEPMSTPSLSCSLQTAELIIDPFNLEATTTLAIGVSFGYQCTFNWVEDEEYSILVGMDLNRLPDYLDPDLKTDMGSYSSVPDSMSFSEVLSIEMMDLDRARIERVGLNGMSRDTDSDGITDSVEALLDWYPLNDDPDNDGLNDFAEIETYGTDPGYRDSDYDGIRDGVELGLGTGDVGDDTSPGSWTERICQNGNPFVFTAIKNYDTETITTTDPLNPDSDGDGLCDGWRDGWSYRTDDYLESNDDFDTVVDQYGFAVRNLDAIVANSMGRFSYRYDPSLWGYYGHVDNLVQVYEGEDLDCDGAFDVGSLSVSTVDARIYRLDDGSGVITTDSAHDIDANLNGDTSWTTGISDDCLDFDGTTDYLDFDATEEIDELISSDYTIEMWVEPGIAMSSGTYGLASNDDETKFGFCIDSDSLILQHKDSTDTLRSITESHDFNADIWYHVAAVFSQDDGMFLYVDGEMIDQDSSLTYAPNYQIDNIGSFGSSGAGSFNGKIDEVGFYTRAFSPTDIFEHYAAMRAVMHYDGTWGFDSVTFESLGTAGETMNTRGSFDTDGDHLPDGWEVWYGTKDPFCDDTGDYYIDPLDPDDGDDDVDEPDLGDDTSTTKGSAQVMDPNYPSLMQYIDLDGDYHHIKKISLLLYTFDSENDEFTFEIKSDGSDNGAGSRTDPWNLLYTSTIYTTSAGGTDETWVTFEIPDYIFEKKRMDADAFNGEFWFGMSYDGDSINWKTDSSGTDGERYSDASSAWVALASNVGYYYKLEYHEDGTSDMGDGLTNFEEYIIGTNPKLKNSDVYDDRNDGDEVIGPTSSPYDSDPKIIFRTSIINGSISNYYYTDVTTDDWIDYDGDQKETEFTGYRYSYISNKDGLPEDTDQILLLGYGTPVYWWNNATSTKNTLLIPMAFYPTWYHQFEVTVTTKDLDTYEIDDDAGYWRNRQILFSDPLHWDSDNDGLADDDEVDWTDNSDYFTSGREYTELGNDPACNVFDPDSDNDGIEDGYEPDYTFDENDFGLASDSLESPVDADSDGDGLWDGTEMSFPYDSDNDGDGYCDACDPDSDGDGLADGWVDGYIWDPDTNSFVDYDSWGDQGTNMPASDSNGVFDIWEGEDRNFDGSYAENEDEDNDGYFDVYHSSTYKEIMLDYDNDGYLDLDDLGGTENVDWKAQTTPYFNEDDGTGDDNDGKFDLETDPLNSDTDDDGLDDGFDHKLDSTNWAFGELINDALSSPSRDTDTCQSDYDDSTDRLDSDSDDDNLIDSYEVLGWNVEIYLRKPTTTGYTKSSLTGIYTNPKDADSDDDSVNDGTESTSRSDPNEDDTDGDGIPDNIEINSGYLDYTDADTDNDGLPDGYVEDWYRDTDGTYKKASSNIDGNTVANPWEGEDLDCNGEIDGDDDEDLIWDVGESWEETSPLDPCTDSDPITDGEEYFMDCESDHWMGTGYDYMRPWQNVELYDGTTLTGSTEYPSGSGNYPDEWYDLDGDGTENALDTDSDDDGRTDGEETGNNGILDATAGTDTDNDHYTAALETLFFCYDSDGDGLGDNVDVWVDFDSDTIIDDNEWFVLADIDGDGLCCAMDEDSDDQGADDGSETGFSYRNAIDDTDGSFYDTDGDGLSDDIEDPDGNGYDAGDPSDYDDTDTDDDGIDDKTEYEYGLDATGNDDDKDNDNLDDYDELNTHETDPSKWDTDGDGLGDGYEYTNGLDPTWPDSDNDGLNDGYEVNTDFDDSISGIQNINPLSVDSDGDGLYDGVEVNIKNTNPYKTDTDGDEITDYIEIYTYGTDPVETDTDGDDLLDGYEAYQLKTNPRMVDSDRDGIDDDEDYFPTKKQGEIALCAALYGIEAYNDDFDGDDTKEPAEFAAEVTFYADENGDKDFTNDLIHSRSRQKFDSGLLFVYDNLYYAKTIQDQSIRYYKINIKVIDEDGENPITGKERKTTADITAQAQCSLDIYYDFETGLWSDIHPLQHDGTTIPTEGAYLTSSNKITGEAESNQYGIGFSSGYEDDDGFVYNAGLYYSIYPCNPDRLTDFGDEDEDGLSAYAERVHWCTEVNNKDTDIDNVPDGDDVLHSLFSKHRSSQCINKPSEVMVKSWKNCDDDEDSDGLSQYEEWNNRKNGANPARQDIFIEMDWMEEHIDEQWVKQPDGGSYYQPAIDASYNMEEIAKYKVLMQFMKRGIGLHIDNGQMGGGTKISYDPVTNDQEWNGDARVQKVNPDIKGDHLYGKYFSNDRQRTYWYCVIVKEKKDTAGEQWRDSIILSYDLINNHQSGIAKVFMHELGHAICAWEGPPNGYHNKNKDNSVMYNPAEGANIIDYSEGEWKYIRDNDTLKRIENPG